MTRPRGALAAHLGQDAPAAYPEWDAMPGEASPLCAAVRAGSLRLHPRAVPTRRAKRRWRYSRGTRRDRRAPTGRSNAEVGPPVGWHGETPLARGDRRRTRHRAPGRRSGHVHRLRAQAGSSALAGSSQGHLASRLPPRCRRMAAAYEAPEARAAQPLVLLAACTPRRHQTVSRPGLGRYAFASAASSAWSISPSLTPPRPSRAVRNAAIARPSTSRPST